MATVYATVADVQERILRQMSDDEKIMCVHLLEDAAVVIDAYNAAAAEDAKRVVSCRMCIRALGDGADGGVPIGATQGTQSALGYSQSWTVSGGGSVGELYLARLDKKLLGVGERIGSYSPTQELVPQPLPEVIA